MSSDNGKHSELSYDPVESPIKPHKAEMTGTVEIIASDADTRLPAAAVPEVCQEFGLAQLSTDAVKELCKLGIAVESNGSVQVGNGMMVVTSRALLKCMLHIEQGITDSASAQKAAKPLCELAGAVKKMGDFWKLRIATNAKAAPGPNRVESFAADKPVQLTQINFHGTPPS